MDKVRIALDAMGGDHAPGEVVKGALEAAGEDGMELLLVGAQEAITPCLAGRRNGLTIIPASQVIDPRQPPVQAVQAQPDSSMMVGMRLVKEGKAQAFVSAGPTGALLASALMVLGRLPGVDRPALGLLYNTPSGPTLFLDVGANPDCRPLFLLHFAQMGHEYMQRVWGVKGPRIGLLSNGEEEGKGNRLVREAYPLLQGSGLNFVGNVEGKDLFSGLAQVVVTDGFTGNVLLKGTEGFGEAIYRELGRTLRGRLLFRPLGLLLRPVLRDLKRKIDYNEYGAAPLLGVRGYVFAAHGRSRARAIMNALLLARRTVGQGQLESLLREEECQNPSS